MGRSSLALVAAALLAGCGGAEDERAATNAPASPRARPPSCIAAKAPGFRLCGQPTGELRKTPSTIQRRDGDGWRTIVAGPPGTVHHGIPIGHWRQAWLSPDGATLLAQWSAECEVPIAFFVDAERGSMRPVTGERKWADAPESIALGWSPDGRARVRLTHGYCGGAKHPPGVYLADPTSGRLTLVKAEARE